MLNVTMMTEDRKWANIEHLERDRAWRQALASVYTYSQVSHSTLSCIDIIQMEVPACKREQFSTDQKGLTFTSRTGDVFGILAPIFRRAQVRTLFLRIAPLLGEGHIYSPQWKLICRVEIREWRLMHKLC